MDRSRGFQTSGTSMLHQTGRKREELDPTLGIGQGIPMSQGASIHEYAATSAGDADCCSDPAS